MMASTFPLTRRGESELKFFQNQQQSRSGEQTECGGGIQYTLAEILEIPVKRRRSRWKGVQHLYSPLDRRRQKKLISLKCLLCCSYYIWRNRSGLNGYTKVSRIDLLLKGNYDTRNKCCLRDQSESASQLELETKHQTHHSFGFDSFYLH